MFGLIESKVNKEIKEKISEIEELKKEKKKAHYKLNSISQMMEYFTNIRDSKKSIVVLSGFLACIGLASFFTYGIGNAVLFMLLVLDGMGICNSVMEIKENKKMLLDSGIVPNTDGHKGLVKSEEELLNRINTIESLISLKHDSIAECHDVKNNIEKIRCQSECIKDDSTKLKWADKHFSTKPELVFDTIEEYNNYMSYDSEFVKGELIRSKVLEKKKDR